MSIMNSKELKARDRGRKQGYTKAVDEMTNIVTTLYNDTKKEVEQGRGILIKEPFTPYKKMLLALDDMKKDLLL